MMTLDKIEQTFEGHVTDAKNIVSLHFKELADQLSDCLDDNDISEGQSLAISILTLAAAINYSTGLSVSSNQDTQALLKGLFFEFSDQYAKINDSLFEISEAINNVNKGERYE